MELGPGELSEVIYVAHYGNACTGLAAGGLLRDTRLAVAGHELHYARTFAAAPRGALF